MAPAKLYKLSSNVCIIWFTVNLLNITIFCFFIIQPLKLNSLYSIWHYFSIPGISITIKKSSNIRRQSRFLPHVQNFLNIFPEAIFKKSSDNKMSDFTFVSWCCTTFSTSEVSKKAIIKLILTDITDIKCY